MLLMFCWTKNKCERRIWLLLLYSFPILVVDGGVDLKSLTIITRHWDDRGMNQL